MKGNTIETLVNTSIHYWIKTELNGFSLMPDSSNSYHKYLKYIENHLSDDKAKKRVKSFIADKLAEQNAQTKAFWERSDQYLNSNPKIKFDHFVAHLFHHIGSALTLEAGAEKMIWHTQLTTEQKAQEIRSVFEKIKELEKLLCNIPQAPLPFHPQSGLYDSTDAEVVNTIACLTRWEKQNGPSMYDHFQDSLLDMKRDLAMQLASLVQERHYKELMFVPAEQTKNKSQAQLIQELVIMFFIIRTETPVQMIVDLCHVFGFQNVDDSHVKNAQRRTKKLLKQ